MSAFSFDSQKSAKSGHVSQVRRLIYGPALVVALAFAASGALALALLLATVMEY